jgi:hypothetical protein
MSKKERLENVDDINDPSMSVNMRFGMNMMLTGTPMCMVLSGIKGFIISKKLTVPAPRYMSRYFFVRD